MSSSAAETSTQLPPPPARVFFQAAPTGGRAGTGPATRDDSVQKKNGKVTVKYDRKELRKRLILEEWIIEQLSVLYDCEAYCLVLTFLLAVTRCSAEPGQCAAVTELEEDQELMADDL
ncbi:UNVERIFIED_CONTAM: hypothetical protein FKN15_040853 [Acipenser sinensis]